MDLRQLKYFVAVAEERHMGRAAERLHLSQPPLSRQIQSLERELGVALFIRTARGVDLTDAGQALLQDARAIRLLAAQAGERAQRVGKGELGTLDVGVFGSSLLNVVPRLLARFSETHPEVDVNIVLHNAHKRQQIDALRQRRILIAFDRFLPDDPDLTIEVVTEEPLLVALNAAHPLAASKTIDMDQLRNELLLLPAGIDSHIGRKLLQLCKDHGFDPRVLPGGGDVITTVAMIAIRADAGLSLIPGSMASLTMPNVAYRPLTARGKASVELHCLYRKDEQSPLLAALLRTVREFREAGPIGACGPP
jgi:LysR family transcriptional regulator, benzoate and cis,cis-muconate-responsive activator of ben and cat genes